MKKLVGFIVLVLSVGGNTQAGKKKPPGWETGEPW
jgi:hypothetical protein